MCISVHCHLTEQDKQIMLFCLCDSSALGGFCSSCSCVSQQKSSSFSQGQVSMGFSSTLPICNSHILPIDIELDLNRDNKSCVLFKLLKELKFILGNSRGTAELSQSWNIFNECLWLHIILESPPFVLINCSCKLFIIVKHYWHHSFWSTL